MSLEEYFSTGPPHERPVCEAVLDYVESMGQVHIEPLSVGIFLKKAQTFAQLRPMQKWVALSFGLARRIDHPTITRKVVPTQGATTTCSTCGVRTTSTTGSGAG